MPEAVADAVPETPPAAWPAPSVPEADHQTVTSIPTLGDQAAALAVPPAPATVPTPGGPAPSAFAPPSPRPAPSASTLPPARPAPSASTPPPAQPWAAPSATPVGLGGAGTADPFAPPGSGTGSPAAPANPFAPPSAGTPAGGAPANPFAPPSAGTPAGGAPANPFAPPGPAAPVPHGHAVPPPPLAPDGPGRVPYGYPGTPAYGYPGHAGGYGGGPQPYGSYGWAGAGPVPPRNGMGTAGLVLGIIAAVGFCMWPVAILAGLLGVIFGVVGRVRARKGEATNSGQALAGIICGAFGLALALGLGILLIVNA
ncbi:DUF4190 domain-containing protein [Streptomyces griseoviridis]|uniref:DUF4190 domain-containing protein n=1 Tax=Streptomyces griseoviridis TaxID=45398 RepID=UPI001E2E2E97|nr:DUF4190 domain-containing protein [Streptomyces niveoruber]